MKFVEFAEIPEQTRNSQTRLEIQAFADQLVENTGKWAQVYEGLKPATASGRAKMLREYDGIETVVRSGSVYAAHKPKQKPATKPAPKK